MFKIGFLLLTFCLINKLSFSQTQVLHENRSESQSSTLTGFFSYQIDAVDYKIEISSDQNSYNEYKSNGQLIGSGQLVKKTDDCYALMPISASPESKIKSEVNFKVQSKTSNGFYVEFQFHELETEIMFFTKVQ